MIREFSAGGLVVRRFHGRPFVAVVQFREGVLALPKGPPDGRESAADAARREVREETGIDGEVTEKLDDVKYWYARGGQRVFKVVSFFLLRYLSGSVRDYQVEEVDSAEWVPLEEAPRLLAYRGERDMAQAALSRIAGNG